MFLTVQLQKLKLSELVAADVLQLIEYIEKIILKNYNVSLVPEVLVLGEE